MVPKPSRKPSIKSTRPRNSPQNPNELNARHLRSRIREAKKQHKIAVLMGVEGGHMMGNDLSSSAPSPLSVSAYMTLTHMDNN